MVKTQRYGPFQILYSKNVSIWCGCKKWVHKNSQKHTTKKPRKIRSSTRARKLLLDIKFQLKHKNRNQYHYHYHHQGE